MIVYCVDDIKIAATKEATEAIDGSLNQRWRGTWAVSTKGIPKKALCRFHRPSSVGVCKIVMAS